ncbi:uncharacterized protein PGTG_11987 [Puccinia graminis f. sp. tritici CRL 75-36-700-3]|uniref:Trimethylguanosine synthase n=1 Tax=Puccinia graminis f. sp. tritici (strain CRL 75-36-700-3 / race SCCL) TaxID=418459 RepID=E3KP06_PUCGT|nr:uncharacterized protein PGTG_11987 [Puccinia graminis f. sp. tritici CRL 75-36-700-3]EFP86031.2 hypothetical protein PGTG_11987 [Puccinia graminis f. sp. tritici CRL 75-36-700-3]
MRILTYAVRKAMALAAANPTQADHQPNHSNPPPENKSADKANDENLIPCAQQSPAHPHEHRSPDDIPPPKRIRLEPEQDGHQEPETMDYLTQENLPPSMEKYWAQRKRLFWKFDEGIKMDLESWYSVTPEAIAKQIATRAKCKLVVDGFCGAGGNSIQFAMTCDKVIAIDKDPNKIKLARSNAKIYGVAEKIEFVCADFLAWMAGLTTAQTASIDVIFLSPPWGGINYLNSPEAAAEEEEDGTIQKKGNKKKPDKRRQHYYKLKELAPIDGHELFKRARQITERIIYYLPRHTDLHDLSKLAALFPAHSRVSPPSKTDRQKFVIEVEENWMNQKCKALTVYFGPLVSSSQPPKKSLPHNHT